MLTVQGFSKWRSLGVLEVAPGGLQQKGEYLLSYNSFHDSSLCMTILTTLFKKTSKILSYPGTKSCEIGSNLCQLGVFDVTKV